jgi:hypothetical protein
MRGFCLQTVTTFLKAGNTPLNFATRCLSIKENRFMKKLSLLFSFVLCITISFAQVQRVKPASDSLLAKNTPIHEGNISKKQIIRELNLTKEQRSKLKELKQDAKAKKEIVNSNDKLTVDEKKLKLKELHLEREKTLLNVLNKDQKVKYMKMKKAHHKNKKEIIEMDNQ